MGLLSIGATWLAWRAHQAPTTGVDDANISLAYAENLTRGFGFVYNVGGERVEGFTSFLWVLICAAIFRAGGGERALLVLSVVLLVATLLVLLGAVRRACLERNANPLLYGLMMLGLTLSCPSYVTWTTITLMDTGLWCAVVTVAAVSVIVAPGSRAWRRAAVALFTILPLVRPEALVIGPVLLVAGLARAWRRPAWAAATTTILMCALPFVAAAVALSIFRVAYFGFPWPNTFYAKVSPSFAYNIQQGRQYLYRFAQSSAIVAIGLLAMVAVVTYRAAMMLESWLRRRSAARLPGPSLKEEEGIAMAALAIVAVPVLTGGDHFPMFRQMQPAYPLMCLLLVLVVLQVATAAGVSRPRQVVSSAILLLCVGPPIGYWLWAYGHDVSWAELGNGRSPLQTEFEIVTKGIARGRRLEALFGASDPKPAVGVTAAGAIRRHYSGPIIDLMGLNNVTIGHWPGDRRGAKNHAAFERDAFFVLLPDIVAVGLPSPGETDPYSPNMLLKGILNDKRFQDQYTFGALADRSRSGPRDQLSAFFKKSWLDQHRTWTFAEDGRWRQQWVSR